MHMYVIGFTHWEMFAPNKLRKKYLGNSCLGIE